MRYHMIESQNNEKWIMYRAVLYNFWYYPNQEFIFKDGCAVLRGHNGSGKSVTTQSLITVVLDGDTRSQRLDPFGGKERKISDTVLGEEELLPHIKSRIGYIALEFRKKNGLTKTIGLGIHAVRDKKQAKKWYFITNGKTVGNRDEDVKLYKTEKFDGGNKEISLTEKELRQTIEIECQCGKVFSDRDEYAAQVNKQLFGFETPEQFKGLIDLLMQIRSPQLSDRNKPEAAATVLNDALPQLTEEELRPLTTSIESIDRLEKDLVRYKSDLKAIDSLNKVVVEYSTLTMAEKADEFLKSVKQFESLKDELEKLQKKQLQRTESLEKAKINLKRIDSEIQALKEEKINLGFEEIEAVQANLTATEKEMKSSSIKLEELEERKIKAERTFREARRQSENANVNKLKHEKALAEFSRELNDYATEMDFEIHQRYFDHFGRNNSQKDYEFKAWTDATFDYKKFLHATKDQLEKYERKEMQANSVRNELGNIDQNIHQIEQQIDALVNKYEQTILNKRDEIELWSYDATAISITAELKQQLQVQIDELFDPLEKEEYFNPLNVFTQSRLNDVLQRTTQLEHEAQLKKTEIDKLNAEIAEWKTEKEVEPSFLTSKQKDWDVLRAQGIDFKPFYEVFEFQADVSDEERLLLQSAFFETGLLSAVVVSPEKIEKASELTAVVQYRKATQNNLSKVLKPSEDSSFYDELLQGISFESAAEGFILNGGYYQTGFIAGKAAFYDENLYIGKEARAQNRLRKIATLEEQVKVEMLLLTDLETEISKVKNEAKSINAERNAFPSVADVENLVKERNHLQDRIDSIIKPEKERKLEFIHNLEIEQRKLMAEIKQKLDFSTLELTTTAFSTELFKLNDYEAVFQDMRSAYKEMHFAKEQEGNYIAQMENAQNLAEEYHSDFIDQEIKLERLNEKITTLQKRLNEMGSEEIITRMREITEQLETILPGERDATIRKTSDLERDIEECTSSILLIENDELPFKKSIAIAWEKTFDVQFRQNRPLFEHLTFTSDLKENAAFIFKTYGSKLDKNRDSIANTLKRLNSRYNQARMELIQYDLDFRDVDSDNLPQFETENDDKQQILQSIKGKMQQKTLTISIHDQVLPIGTGAKILQEKINDLETLQTEKDRELFQDILCNTLADSIRGKIHYVESWEKKMNLYMEHENIIKFRIKWVPKVSEKEGEMHTRKLVEELKKDSRWVDVSAISRHFKSKIKDAKARAKNESEVNLQQLMRELLDYRSWFDFEIYFTKHGGKERRLNKNSYGELSGGQRVLAMVTPVLAALYSKYLDGKNDAPQIFTLDEAFARVDEENINVMFTYIHKLGFNYILNSQGLWGCFESVPSLNIYELSRPNNKPHVFVQSYYWNGNSRINLNTKDQSYATVGSH